MTCLSLLGLQLWYLGYPDQALHQSSQALTLVRQLSHPFSLAEALFFSGVVHILRRKVQAAQERLGAVLALSTEQGFPHWVTLGTVLCGWTRVAQGQGDVGMAQMRQGLEAWRGTSGEAARPWLLSLLAEAYSLAEAVEEGLTVVAEALALVRTREERQPEAELCRLTGELQLARSMTDAAEAEASFQQALTIARQQQAKALDLRAAVSLSQLWRRQGKRAEARQLLTGIYRWFAEGFDAADLREAKTVMEELSAPLA